MTLIIEDGSNVSGANSYITVAEYTAWANARFGASRASLPSDEAAYEALIYRAMDYFEAQPFKGLKVNDSQPLQHPRSGLVIDGYYVDTNEIAKEVKLSLYELAYVEERGNSELASIGRQDEMIKVGPITVKTSDNAASRTVNVSVPNAMRKLIGGGGYGSANFMAGRG